MSGKGKIGPTVYADLDGATGTCDVTVQCSISLDRQWKCPFGAFYTDPPEEGERCQWLRSWLQSLQFATREARRAAPREAGGHKADQRT